MRRVAQHCARAAGRAPKDEKRDGEGEYKQLRRITRKRATISLGAAQWRPRSRSILAIRELKKGMNCMISTTGQENNAAATFLRDRLIPGPSRAPMICEGPSVSSDRRRRCQSGIQH